MYASTAQRHIGRLEKIDADLTSAMGRLDRIEVPGIELSVEQARESLAKTQSWVADAILCLRIDAGIHDGDD